MTLFLFSFNVISQIPKKKKKQQRKPQLFKTLLQYFCGT